MADRIAPGECRLIKCVINGIPSLENDFVKLPIPAKRSMYLSSDGGGVLIGVLCVYE